MHIQGKKKKKSLLHYVHNTTLQFTNFIISQLPINYKVSNKLNFYFKRKKKKTLTDKNNYLPLKNLLSITFVKKKKKKICYSYKHKKTKKRRRQNLTHRAQHVGGMEDINPPLDSRHFYYFL